MGYLLICPGRVGTQQADMGIPVQWSDISATRCIVETDIQGVDVPPSEGEPSCFYCSSMILWMHQELISSRTLSALGLLT